mgnify:CR=1 FL=1
MTAKQYMESQLAMRRTPCVTLVVCPTVAPLTCPRVFMQNPEAVKLANRTTAASSSIHSFPHTIGRASS